MTDRARLAAVALLALLLAGVVAPAPDAGANGRSPATSTIHFERGNEQHIVAGMTFGLLLSGDGGSSWTWMCEDAIGYGGTYDPAYAYTHTGAIFATTFNGLAVMRDGCTFTLDPATTCTSATHCTFVSADTTDGSASLFYAAADPADSQVFRSQDDGSSFPQIAMPGPDNTYWESIAVAPSDDARLYLTGYLSQNGVPKQFFNMTSSDGGSSFTTMAGGSAFPSFNSTTVDIASIDPADPNTLYVTVNPQAIVNQHAVFGLWKTTDAGSSFTQLMTSTDFQIYAVARKNGDLVAATQGGGVQISHDKGSSFSAPIAGTPHINCLTENSAGELWACTLNYGTPTLPSDGAGIMTSLDGSSWTPSLKFQDIVSPASCPAGTPQHDTCEVMNWCMLKQTLGITSTVIDCAPPLDAGPLADPALPKQGAGCCDGGGGGGGVVVLAGAIAMLLLRRRASQPC